MRVLVACEFSGRVREAFRALGHDAWSCDLLPAEDDSEFHMMLDVRNLIRPDRHWSDLPPWDLMVAHPPCTHLSVSGARHFEAKRADGRQQEAIDFFMALVNAPIQRIAIENPVCIMSSIYRKPDQTIQPHDFGHGETKATCLWLKNLPRLIPTHKPGGDLFTEVGPVEREARVHLMPPGPNRWKERSRTYAGIARAMAEQWGAELTTAAPVGDPKRTEQIDKGIAA